MLNTSAFRTFAVTSFPSLQISPPRLLIPSCVVLSRGLVLVTLIVAMPDQGIKLVLQAVKLAVATDNGDLLAAGLTVLNHISQRTGPHSKAILFGERVTRMVRVISSGDVSLTISPGRSSFS